MHQVRIEITRTGRADQLTTVSVQDVTIMDGVGALDDTVTKLGQRAVKMMEEGEKK